MRRRSFLAGSAALALGGPAGAADVSRRVFRIVRSGDDIGQHSMEAWLTPKGFEIAINIDIRVKILGVTAYRYSLTNREVWKDGTLLSLNSLVNDDGSEEFSRVRRDGNVLKVEGTGYTGDAPLQAATTSYFTPDFHTRSPWISTQSGQPLSVSVNPQSGRKGWWTVSGELDTNLGYDSRGEWTGCEFDAGGELARYEVVSESGLIAPLWDQS